MSRMLEFESSEDVELIDLAFSFELLGFEFQRGDRDETEFIAALRDAAEETWLAPFLDIDLERTVIRLDSPLSEIRTALPRSEDVGGVVRAIIYTDAVFLDSSRKVGIISFPTH